MLKIANLTMNNQVIIFVVVIALTSYLKLLVDLGEFICFHNLQLAICIVDTL